MTDFTPPTPAEITAEFEQLRRDERQIKALTRELTGARQITSGLLADQDTLHKALDECNSEKNQARKERDEAVALLRVVRERCPGIYTTDQETGETFDTLLDAFLARLDAKGTR